MLPSKIVRNIRYGLATNSSSSHSIIHNPTLIKDHGSDGNDGDLNYGWEFFTLDTKEAKKRYLLAQLSGNIPYSQLEIFKFILRELGYTEVAEKIDDMGVDHQSAMLFPSNINGGVHSEFFSEYMKYLIDGDFVILGGNDNADYEHDLAGLDDGQETYFQAFDKSITYKNGNYWVIQNSGKKLRVQFNGEEPKAVMPELIDIKITDRCSMGCDFCFVEGTRVNTPNGFVDINNLKLGDKVFAFDEKNEELTVNTVDQVFERDFQGEIVIIELEDNRIIEVTSNHEILTINRGWVEAGKLTEEDELYGFKDM